MKSSSANCYTRRSVAPVLLSFLLLLIDDNVVGSFAATYREDDAVRTRTRSSIIATKYNTNSNDPERNQKKRRNQQQQYVEDYKLWDASRIPEVLKEWKEKYPDLIRVTTSQEAYGLPAAGTLQDCPFYEKQGCPNYFFTLQDYTLHPVDSLSSSYLPEVFWSGCLHGNERVGPTSVMEASTLLLEAAYCEGLPRRSSSSLDSDLKEAKACRHALRNKGIDDVHRKWLARLVSTRRIVVVPTTNGKTE